MYCSFSSFITCGSGFYVFCFLRFLVSVFSFFFHLLPLLLHLHAWIPSFLYLCFRFTFLSLFLDVLSLSLTYFSSSFCIYNKLLSLSSYDVLLPRFPFLLSVPYSFRFFFRSYSFRFFLSRLFLTSPFTFDLYSPSACIG